MFCILFYIGIQILYYIIFYITISGYFCHAMAFLTLLQFRKAKYVSEMNIY